MAIDIVPFSCYKWGEDQKKKFIVITGKSTGKVAAALWLNWDSSIAFGDARHQRDAPVWNGTLVATWKWFEMLPSASLPSFSLPPEPLPVICRRESDQIHLKNPKASCKNPLKLPWESWRIGQCAQTRETCKFTSILRDSKESLEIPRESSIMKLKSN